MSKTWLLKIDKEMEQYLICDRFTDGLGIKQYVFRFPNNYGASVIKGFGTYGVENDLWELAVLSFNRDDDNEDFDIDYDTDITDDVVGYLDDERVNELLMQIMGLDNFKGA